MTDTPERTRNAVAKIAAIKALRETLDIGLKDAKDVVDAAIWRYRPDEAGAWTGKELMLVAQNRCLNCNTLLTDDEQGVVYCSVDCFDQVRRDKRNDRFVRQAQQEVDELKQKLAAAEMRLSDAQDRRAGF